MTDTASIELFPGKGLWDVDTGLRVLWPDGRKGWITGYDEHAGKGCYCTIILDDGEEKGSRIPDLAERFTRLPDEDHEWPGVRERFLALADRCPVVYVSTS